MVRVRTIHLAVIVPLAFVLGIGASMVLGYWNTDSSRGPMRISSGRLAGEAATGRVNALEVDHDDEVAVVRGMTTFADLLDWGLTREEIEQVLGFPIVAGAQTVREASLSSGVRFSDAKARLQRLLESGTNDVRE